MMLDKLFPTTVVGSMPRPQFFREMVDRYLAEGDGEEELQRLMDKAIPYVAALQEAAGIDIISDGEWRRKSYIGVIADMVTGFELQKTHVDSDRHSAFVGYTVTGQVEPVRPGLFAREARFLKAHTDRQVRVALPTPYHLGQVTWNPERSARAYPTKRDFIEALVPIFRQELIALRDEGVRYVQFDDTTIGRSHELYTEKQYPDHEKELAYAVDSLNRVVDGVDGVYLSLHLCGKRPVDPQGEPGAHPLLPGLKELNFNMVMFELSDPDASDMRILRELPEHMDIGVGCVKAKQAGIESPEEIVQRVRRSLDVVAAERVMLHPDCGFSPGAYWDIPIDEAYQKLHNEALAAEILRDEFG